MKRLQNGRSMIEMLGVLAIIGVLSIGGLAGYTMAMNRYRANNVLDYIARCGVVAQTAGMGEETYTNKACSELLAGETAPSSLTAATVSGTSPAITITATYSSDNVAQAVATRSSSDANGVKIKADGSTFCFANATGCTGS